MRPWFLAVLAAILLSGIDVLAQDIALQNSGKMISDALAKYKSQKREEAIRVLSSIHAGDTNYVKAQLLAAEMCFEKKDYKRTKAFALQALIMPSANKNSAYNLLALSYHHLGINDSSDYYSAVGMEAFPFDELLVYNRGIVLNARGKTAEAIDYFFRTIRLKSNFVSAHFMLGYLAIRADRPVQALMAWGFYALLEDDNLDGVKDIEKTSGLLLDLDEELKIVQWQVPNAFKALDKRFYAGEALQKGFKTGVKLDYAFVKQYRLILDNLASINDAKDPYYKHYGSFYQQVEAAKLFEPFVRQLLAQADDKKNQKWLKSNAKSVEALFKVAGNHANQLMDRQQFQLDGKPYDLECWYKDFEIQSLGEADSTNFDYKKGQWFYINSNGSILSRGFYQNYKPEGKWEFFNEEGWLEKVVHFKEGKLHGDYFYYSSDGVVTAHTTYKDGLLVDTGKYYYPCGALDRVTAFKDQEKHGLEVAYHFNGRERYRRTYNAGMIVDTVREWHDNGQLSEVAFYDSSENYHGPFVAYHANGKLYLKGTYKAGKKVGNWLQYSDNGQLVYNVNYNESGQKHGKWLQFSVNGLPETDHEYENDEQAGTQLYYEQGKLLYRIQSLAGSRYVKEDYFDDKGNLRVSYGDADGNFGFEAISLKGRKFSEGRYVNGLASGEWKYYDNFGNVVRRSLFNEGLRDGKDVFYNAMGNVIQEQNWEDGDLNGMVKFYYPNGTLKEVGNYVDGQAHGRWESYHENGRVHEVVFFFEGRKTGPAFYYAASGGLKRQEYFGGSAVRSETYFDREGQPFHTNKYPGGNGTEIWPFSNNRKRLVGEIRCDRKVDSVIMYHQNGMVSNRRFFVQGKLQGKELSYYASGKIEAERTFIDDVLHGNFKSWFENGKVQKQGQYTNGAATGEWKMFYENGQLELLERFDEEGNLHGWTQFYDALGQLAFEKFFERGELKAMRYLLPSGKYCEPINMDVDTISVTTYFRNGKISSRQFFKAGMRHNESVLYHSDGSVKIKCFFILNELHGPYEDGDPGGIIRESGRYVNGDYDGLIKIFNEKGLLSRELTYYAGWKEGIESTFDAAGKLVKTEKWWMHEAFPVKNGG